MSRRETLLAKLRNNQNNVSFVDLESLLVQYGFALARTASSHCRYHREGCPQITVTRHGAQVRPAAVKEVLRILDEYVLDTE